jgi:methylglutaconyl-CoA hydratase
MYQFLTVPRDGPVEYLTLNRPDVRNAFNDVVIAELQRWADAAATDGSLRVVVLGGAGTVFSAGADATWMAAMAGYSREENEADARRTTAMLRALNTLPVGVIGRIQGAALGGGAGLAAICDVVVAEERAIFGFTESNSGSCRR